MQITKTQLAAQIAGMNAISVKAATQIVGDVFSTIAKHVSEGDEVAISGFGKFIKKTTAAREGRNPSNGETIQIPAKSRVKFTAGKKLKDTVN